MIDVGEGVKGKDGEEMSWKGRGQRKNNSSVMVCRSIITFLGLSNNEYLYTKTFL